MVENYGLEIAVRLFPVSTSMAAEVGKDATDIALKVARALNAVSAEYFLGGSLASSLQGEPRATNDIDFVIALPLGSSLRVQLSVILR